jgi:hypothetical protein
MKPGLSRFVVPLCVLLVGVSSVVAPPVAHAQSKKSKASKGEASVTAAADARYTIFCVSIDGPGHVERAIKLKSELLRLTDLKDWHLLHQEGNSVLYYGRYRCFNDPSDKAESERAQRDRAMIDSMTDQSGTRPFRQAVFVELESPDPMAPPEWNLANAPGVWTLQIAAYKDSPERKQAALDTVKAAREQGIEAYVHHGPSVSSVCVGSWPQEAVIIHDPFEQRNRDTAVSLIVTDRPLGIDLTNVRDNQNNPVQLMERRVEIRDESLLATMRQYPTHSVNGFEEVIVTTDPQTQQKTRKPAPSFVVAIPKNQSSGSMLTDRQTGGASDQTPPPPPPPPAKKSQGVGKLKSVGQ